MLGVKVSSAVLSDRTTLYSYFLSQCKPLRYYHFLKKDLYTIIYVASAIC